MTALVATAHGVYAVDLATEAVLGLRDEVRGLARTNDRTGSVLAVVVEGRPPLRVSYDAGETWHDAGRGLPEGRAVAVADDDPDTILFAGRNRLYLSRDGGRFWHALAVELPEIEAVGFEP